MDLSALQANYQPVDVGGNYNQQVQDAMKKKQSGNWMTHLIPTAGAVLGGIVGIPGDLFSAGASSIGGAAIGSGLGKALENKLEGNQDLTSGVAGDTIMGGLGQGGGMVAGHLIGGLGSVTKKYGTDLLSSVGGKLSKSEAQAYKLRNTTDTLANYGVKPGEFQNVADQVTGQNGIVTKLTRQAVGAASPVDTTGVDTLTQQLLANEPLLNGTAEKKVLDVITNGLDNLNGRGKGFSATGSALTKKTAAGTNDILNSGANPLDTFDFVKQLESKAATLMGNGKNPLGISDEAKATANVYRNVADELKDRLFTGAGADNAVANHLITPDVVNQLTNIRPGDKNWGAFVQKIMQSQTVKDLRSAASPFVKAGQIQSAKEAAAQGGSDAGRVMKGALDLGGLGLAVPTSGASLIPAAISHALTTDTGKTVTGNFLRDPFSKVPDLISNPMGSAVDAAGKILPQAIAHTPDFSSPETAMNPQSTSPLDHPANQTAIDAITQMNNELLNPDTTQPGVTGYTDDQLTQGLTKAIQAGDVKAATEIQNLLKLNQSGNKGNSLGQVQKRSLAQINTAIDRIQRVSKDYESFNIGNGPLGKAQGTLEKIKGHVGLNSSVGAYNDQLSDVAFEIAKALAGGSSGNVSDVRVKQIERGLPKVTDTHEQAVIKINNLLHDLMSAQKEYVSAPATAGDNVADPNSYTGSGFSSNPSQVQFAQ